jgi:hypothetical protein
VERVLLEGEETPVEEKTAARLAWAGND